MFLKTLLKIIFMSFAGACVVTMILISSSNKISSVDKSLWCVGLLFLELFFIFLYDNEK